MWPSTCGSLVLKQKRNEDLIHQIPDPQRAVARCTELVKMLRAVFSRLLFQYNLEVFGMELVNFCMFFWRFWKCYLINVYFDVIYQYLPWF